MDQLSASKHHNENTFSLKKHTMVKIHLGSFNFISEFGGIFKQVIQSPPPEQVEPLTEPNGQVHRDFQVKLEGRDLFPPPYKSTKRLRLNKIVEEQQESMIMTKKKTSQKAKKKIAGQKHGETKLRTPREIDLHFSLTRLAQPVKTYIEHSQVTNLDKIYQGIFGRYLEKYPKKTTKGEEVMVRLKRRILEVLRVLNGSDLIEMEKRTVCITAHGRLKGKAIMRMMKREKEKVEQIKKKLFQLIECRNNLQTMLKEFMRIRERNSVEIQKIKGNLLIENVISLENQRFPLPLKVISGHFQSMSSVSKPPVVGVIDQRKNNSTIIKGGNMKIYSFGEILCLIAKQQSTNN